MKFQSQINKKVFYAYQAKYFEFIIGDERHRAKYPQIEEFMNQFPEYIEEQRRMLKFFENTRPKATCPVCGKVFAMKFSRQTNCWAPECEKEYAKRYIEKVRAEKRYLEYDRNKKRKERATVKPNKSQLADKAKVAREKGMTYGELQAEETKKLYARVEI